ncbi:hypothetical protein GCM10028805_37290 [Spirosoma harenae]
MTLFGQSLSPELAAKIDSSFSTWNSTQSPGAVVGIVHRGQLLYQKSFGMANLSRQQALSVNHQFWVASMAKQFTAACVALLAEQGKLRLDDDIRQYLPELQTGHDTIRIRQLIDHTSGLRDGFTLIGLTLKGERHYTNQQVMEKLYRQQQLNFTPGSRHEYNNGGYVVLAELVSRVSGKPFADFAQEAIFTPLGMSHTRFYGRLTASIPHLASGYRPSQKLGKTTYRAVRFKANTVGSTGLVTTLEDLLKWDRNFYQNQLGKKEPAFVQRLTTPSQLNDGTVIPYAFGLEVEPYGGELAITHSGSDPGYQAELVRFPHQELSLICLANTTNLYNLTDLLLTIGRWLEPSIQRQPTEPARDSVLKPIQPLAGLYLHPANQAEVRFIRVKNNQLYVARSEHGWEEPLKQRQALLWTNQGNYSHHWYAFSPDHKTLSLRSRAFESTLERVETAQHTVSDLKRLAGRYYSPELGKVYRLTRHKNTLRLSFFHLVHVPLLALANNQFLADLQGNNCLTFSDETTGSVAGFTLSRDGVTNLRFIKK